MNISSGNFLRFVGFEYVMLGVVGLTALLLPSSGLLMLCGLGQMALLVSPLDITFEYGGAAWCYELPKGGLGCNWNDDAIQNARAVISALCIISVVGGLSGIWAASTKDKPTGRVVWFVLMIVSVVVALSNFLWYFKSAMAFSPFVFVVQTCWAAGYVVAYVRWSRSNA
jgi:hypothetical protein